MFGSREVDNDIDNSVFLILKENDRRNSVINSPFNPITGKGSVGERVKVVIEDFSIQEQWLPKPMLKIPLVRSLIRFGSIKRFLEEGLKVEYNELDKIKVSRQFIRLRFQHDFPFWAASIVYIQNKKAGKNVLFRLYYPQRILVSKFEERRLSNKPIRLILLKARQWGGSTTTQLYMAWLQFMHKKGLNSLIIAHQSSISEEIKDMFDTMLSKYPVEFLHSLGEQYSEDEPKMVRVGQSGSTHRVPQRVCKIKIGTAERPDSCRGGSYSLVHLSEVGIWKKTEGKSPEDIVRSACSGILYEPLTMIVMESTANGTGNFFHREYSAASDPLTPSQYDSLFIAWYQIENYSIPFDSEDEKIRFATNLYKNRDNQFVSSTREECGKYLWGLWEKGATLEAIHWYVTERSGRNDFSVMASEYPSDDIEAFVHSGHMVFDKYQIDDMKKKCFPAKYVGEVVGDSEDGEDALKNLRFVSDHQGLLQIWSKPEEFTEYDVTERYLTVVDIGGRSNKSDFSVITVFDRIGMIDGDEPPIVVAQWRGHCDIDVLAWKSAQIASYYLNSLLVIESNTLETHDKERQIEGGDQSQYVLNQISCVYDNLYARRQSEDEIRNSVPRKYGFHTNTLTKPMVISALIRAVRKGLYVERCVDCLDEFLTYERKQNGSYGAIDGKHDDMLMTRAIGIHICYSEMEHPMMIPKKREMRLGKTKPVSEAVI